MSKNSKSKNVFKSILENKRRRKYLIIGSTLLLVFAVLLIIELSPMRLLSSLYNIEDVEKSIGKIKVGDVINYEINGYSNWQVVSVDKGNNTLDVVSKTNTEDLTFTTKSDYEGFLNILQETANKYTDNKYAIKARSVNRADLDNFGFDEEFWNADIYDGKIAYTGGSIEYRGTDDDPTTYYFLPFIRYIAPGEFWTYSVGDEYDLSIGGVDKWVFVEQPQTWNSTIFLVAAEPIEIDITNPELMLNPENYFNNLINTFRNAENVTDAGNYRDYGFDTLRNNDEVKNYFNAKSNNYKFFNGYPSVNKYFNYIEVGFDAYVIDYEKEKFDSSWISYRKPTAVTKGFRPVVTLKYSNKLVDGKNLNTDLEIGDNVNYSANEYNNWKVLSIDGDNNTVDVISGGVVKNLSLYGIDDYDNYEKLLQLEVDKYKVGDRALSARIVEYNDLPDLNNMNDRVNVKYWTYEKKDYNKKAVDDTSSPYATNAYYDAAIMFYNINENLIQRKWVSLYISSGLTSGGNSVLTAYNGAGDLAFTAGIRPVITLKLDEVEKVDEETKEEIIDKEKEKEEEISNEQKSNSNEHVTNDKTKTNTYTTVTNKTIKNSSSRNSSSSSSSSNSNSTNSDNKDTSVEGNKEVENTEDVNNYYNTTVKKGESDKLIKYIIIAIFVLNIAVLGQIVLSVFMLKGKGNK